MSLSKTGKEMQKHRYSEDNMEEKKEQRILEIKERISFLEGRVSFNKRRLLPCEGELEELRLLRNELRKAV